MEDQNLFKIFIDLMNQTLKDNHEINSESQSKLFNQLFKVEREFRSTLLSNSHGKEMYKKFMNFIIHEKGNTLHARPYFRERQDTFSKKMSKAFDDFKPEVFHRFRINFPFANWVLNHWTTSEETKDQKEKLDTLFVKIKYYRQLLCENSLPLAINRSRIFWSKTTEYHLEYMDLIQNSSEGLLTAIDKFTPPYKTVFRSTAIGRMTLNMMTDYNATMVKLPPKEKRILYRHTMAKNRKNIEGDKKVLDFINESFAGVTQESLNHIVSAAATITPLDYKPEDGLSLTEKLSCGSDPEITMQATEEATNLAVGIASLGVIEKKVVSLKTGY